MGNDDHALFGKGLSRKVVVGTKKNLRNNYMIPLSKRQTSTASKLKHRTEQKTFN